MEIDQALKIILILSISISIFIVSYQLARLLLDIRKMIKDSREDVLDIISHSSDLTFNVTNDYNKIKNVVAAVSGPTKFLKWGLDAGIIDWVSNFRKGKSK